MKQFRTLKIVLLTAVCTIAIMFCLQLVISYAGIRSFDIFSDREKKAMRVLDDLNIESEYDYNPVAVLYDDSHGGFHFDGELFAVVDVGYANRETVFEAIGASEGWTEEEISLETQRGIMGDLGISDAAQYFTLSLETDFDAWYFADDYAKENGKMADIGSQPISFSGIPDGAYPNFTVAFYDTESGLLLYYESDI